MRFERRFSTASELWPRRLARLAITPGRLLGKERLLEPKSAFEQSARLRAGTEKETEGVTLVSTRHSPRQFPLRPYSMANRSMSTPKRTDQNVCWIGIRTTPPSASARKMRIPACLGSAGRPQKRCQAGNERSQRRQSISEKRSRARQLLAGMTRSFYPVQYDRSAECACFFAPREPRLVR